MSIESRVVAILADNVGMRPQDISQGSKLADDLTMDSIDFIQATMYLEDEFNIPIEDDALEQCKTVEDVVALVSRLIGGEV